MSADSLLIVINDILDFSKIEAGKLELDSVEFDLAELLRDSLAPLGVLARQKGLVLWQSLTPGAPMRLVGDPGRLRQVLLNLAGNAVKFTETGCVGILAEAERFLRRVRLAQPPDSLSNSRYRHRYPSGATGDSSSSPSGKPMVPPRDAMAAPVLVSASPHAWCR